MATVPISGDRRVSYLVGFQSAHGGGETPHWFLIAKVSFRSGVGP
jgi:hypothetical protein